METDKFYCYTCQSDTTCKVEADLGSIEDTLYGIEVLIYVTVTCQKCNSVVRSGHVHGEL